MVVLVLSTPNVDEHRERERNSSARGGNKNLAVCCDVLWRGVLCCVVLWVSSCVCMCVRRCLSSDYSCFPPQHRTVPYHHHAHTYRVSKIKSWPQKNRQKHNERNARNNQTKDTRRLRNSTKQRGLSFSIQQ